MDSIREGLEGIELPPLIVDTLMKGIENGAFSEFKGAGHISAKACRSIIPQLKLGLVYDKACLAAGYRHTDRLSPTLDGPGLHQNVKKMIGWLSGQIANPVARKALIEGIKQVAAVVNEYGLPNHIHIELARDVGKGKEERDEIKFGIEKRNKAKDRLRLEFKELIGAEVTGSEDLLRFELWKEQQGRCLYTDREIHLDSVVSSDNTVQVDHILPWSRSGDDSFINKTLCFASANQDKKGRTPFEWLGSNEAGWAAFTAGVEGNKSMKGRKKRNYLLRDASILEEKFRPRNLGDTRYATRLLADGLKQLYPNDGTRHVYARPGPLTDRLRRGWGIQSLKKGADGKRIKDDRHHALDALVVAATSEAALQRLTKAFQDAERIGAHRDFARLDPPWPGFVEETRLALAGVRVSRAERRRARGEAHAATIRQIATREGKQLIYERKKIEELSEGDLEHVKDVERNAKLVESLRQWVAAGKPKDSRPLSPKGDPIAKVRLKTTKKPDVLIRDGAADRGEITRVDVFRKKNKKGVWEFFLVPVYPHQIADEEDWPAPPNCTVQGGKTEDEWPKIDANHEFCWSLYPLSFVEVTKQDGEVIEGYFRSFDRNTGALTISPHQTKEEIRKGIGARTLHNIRKFHIDRLGRRYEIKQETRTWHGVACT